MTDEPSGSGAGGSAEDERAARLAALLSVDIGLPARPGAPAADDAARAFTAYPAPKPKSTEPEELAEPATETPETSDERPDPVEPPPPTPTTPARRETPKDWRAFVPYVVLLVLLVSGLALTYVGTRIVRNSTQGEVVAQGSDPDEPGYEALVEATPTFAVFHDRGDEVDSIAVLTLPDPDGNGGGVILVPTRAVVDMPLFEVSPVEVAYDLGDDRVAAETVGLLLGAAIEGRAVIDDARWADLVAPVAPITIDNPNELLVDDEVRFPIGEIDLAPEDVGPYLAARVEGESDLARLFRHQLFWESWLQAIAADGSPAAVPGEIDTGIGRFVRTLAAGNSVIETLPVEPALPGAYGPEPAFLPDGDAVADLVYRLVPFPISPAPGVRARTRVLNGTADTTRAASIASDLTPVGLEIVLVGNASSFDVEQTTVRYFGAEFRDEAEAIVDLLGVGEVSEETRPSDAVDITVTLGADYE